MKVTREELMQLHDGELPPAEARALAERVAASPEATAQLAALAELSTLARAHYQDAADESDAQLAAAWARIEGQLEAPPAREGTVTPIGTRRRARPLGYIAASAMGLAAGALLVMTLGKHPVRIVTVDVPVPAPREPTLMASAPTDTEVDGIEAPGASSTMVFQVPGEASDRPPTTIVWVTDDDVPEGPI
jgi:anti-sigma factor RsiW